MTPRKWLRMRDYRKEVGFSQSDLAKVMGVRTNTIARWERGVLRPSRMVRRFLEVLIDRDRIAQRRVYNTDRPNKLWDVTAGPLWK